MRAAEDGFPALRDFATNLHCKVLFPTVQGAVVNKRAKNELVSVV